MTAKIVFLFALLLPSILIAQVNKEAFSVELKIGKTNFVFGEDVDANITVKNISGKMDSLEIEELYNIFNCNVTLLYNSEKTSFCLCILTTRDHASYRIFQPNESYSGELSVRGICGNASLDQRGSVSVLDTGSYSVETYLSRAVHRGLPNQYSVRIKSNSINFYVNPSEGIEKESFEELKSIISYSLEKFRDTVFMLTIANKLDEFVRKYIDTYAGDLAFSLAEYTTWRVSSYKSDFLNLSEYYLLRKPNGPDVRRALYLIYRNSYDRTKKYEEGILKMEKYIEENPGTRIEKEAKKVLNINFDR